jgi:hypothetical protein
MPAGSQSANHRGFVPINSITGEKMYTTLNKIRAHSPCVKAWRKLLKHLGKTEADDDRLSIKTVFESNGIDDAWWCLRAVEGHDREIRLYGVWCARNVQHLMTDPRSINALDVAARYAKGMATIDELTAARAAAGAAAGDAAWAAAGDAAGAAAGDAAWAAAWAAAGAAARDAGAAARDAGAAARAAARAAAGAAARDAAWAAARAAARAEQAKELIRVCDCIEQGIDPYPETPYAETT